MTLLKKRFVGLPLLYDCKIDSEAYTQIYTLWGIKDEK